MICYAQLTSNTAAKTSSLSESTSSPYRNHHTMWYVVEVTPLMRSLICMNMPDLKQRYIKRCSLGFSSSFTSDFTDKHLFLANPSECEFGMLLSIYLNLNQQFFNRFFTLFTVITMCGDIFVHLSLLKVFRNRCHEFS